MSTQSFVPPLRDLPPGRLAQRMQHLRAEISGQERRGSGRPRATALAAIGLAILAVVIATPALGLGQRIVHLFANEKQRPSDWVQHYFGNMVGPNGTKPGVLPKKARVAVRLSIDGYGSKVLWVAPTRAGGYCTTYSCNPQRKRPFDMSMQVDGPNSKTPPEPGSRDLHVFIEGDTPLPGAARVAIRFEDGSSQRVPLVRVPAPIDARFFVYELPKDHWDAGGRPVSLALESRAGRQLARDTRIAGWVRQGLGGQLAPPPAPAQPEPTATFTDRAGDARSSLDITKVDVTERPHGFIDFEVTVNGSVNEDEDGPLVALDLDQNPDTGSAFYGAEVEFALVGFGYAREAEGVVYQARGWDFRGTRRIRASWGFGPHSVEFGVKRSALRLKPNQGFNIVAGSVGEHPDTAPDYGTFNYQPVKGTQPPALGPDRRPPKVLAFDSTAAHDGDAKLSFWVLDGRGKTRQVIRIFNGTRLLKTISTPLVDTNPFGLAGAVWHVPRKVQGKLRFSVRSIDAAGNTSAAASAELLVR